MGYKIGKTTIILLNVTGTFSVLHNLKAYKVLFEVLLLRYNTLKPIWYYFNSSFDINEKWDGLIRP